MNLAKYLSAKCGHIVKTLSALECEICIKGAEFSKSDPGEFHILKKPGQIYLLGAGNNTIIAPNIDKIALLDDLRFERLDEFVYEFGASYSARQIYNFARENNLSGAEFLAHIPGSLGALVRGNAGLPGASMSDIAILVNENDSYKELDFAYRKSSANGLIKSAQLRFAPNFNEQRDLEFKNLRARQPKGAGFGSCFKNPPNASAGALIEQAGLKGHKIGGAFISKEHANFFLNSKEAKFDDFLALILLARKAVYEQFGIMLEPEVQIFI